MTGYQFYFGLATVVEFFCIVPVFLALKRWKVFPGAFRYFALFIGCEFIYHRVQDYYFNRNLSTRFLDHYYLFAVHTLLGLFFLRVLETGVERRWFYGWFTAGYLLLLINFFYISKTEYSYFPDIVLNLGIAGWSCYFLYKVSVKYIRNYSLLYLLLGLTFQMVLWVVDKLSESIFIDSQAYSMIWLDEKIIFYYLLMLVFFLYTYVFYTYKHD